MTQSLIGPIDKVSLHDCLSKFMIYADSKLNANANKASISGLIDLDWHEEKPQGKAQ